MRKKNILRGALTTIACLVIFPLFAYGASKELGKDSDIKAAQQEEINKKSGTKEAESVKNLKGVDDMKGSKDIKGVGDMKGTKDMKGMKEGDKELGKPSGKEGGKPSGKEGGKPSGKEGGKPSGKEGGKKIGHEGSVSSGPSATDGTKIQDRENMTRNRDEEGKPGSQPCKPGSQPVAGEDCDRGQPNAGPRAEERSVGLPYDTSPGHKPYDPKDADRFRDNSGTRGRTYNPIDEKPFTDSKPQ